MKSFRVIGVFATTCVTVVALYAIYSNAEWAGTGIVVGMVCATLTVIAPIAQHVFLRFRSQADGSKAVDVEVLREHPSSIGEQTNDSGSRNDSALSA
uniref:Uncharacterized protein n=1 Tax=Candidatus Kentrum sp. TC TaxID=2126339 RepID=A0A450ZK15_9GAMM|nr:MAG: hypothetical protein BECKTC1821F_GA0114240_100412 [Candidatus Kentron sp. TC]